MAEKVTVAFAGEPELFARFGKGLARKPSAEEIVRRHVIFVKQPSDITLRHQPEIVLVELPKIKVDLAGEYAPMAEAR